MLIFSLVYCWDHPGKHLWSLGVKARCWFNEIYLKFLTHFPKIFKLWHLYQFSVLNFYFYIKKKLYKKTWKAYLKKKRLIVLARITQFGIKLNACLFNSKLFWFLPKYLSAFLSICPSVGKTTFVIFKNCKSRFIEFCCSIILN